MTIEEIRKNAPDGATHYYIYNNRPYYIKQEMVWFRNSWCFATFKKGIDIKPL